MPTCNFSPSSSSLLPGGAIKRAEEKTILFAVINWGGSGPGAPGPAAFPRCCSCSRPVTLPRRRLSSPDTDKELLRRCVFAREHIHIKAAWIILLQTICCVFCPSLVSFLISSSCSFPSISHFLREESLCSCMIQNQTARVHQPKAFLQPRMPEVG